MRDSDGPAPLDARERARQQRTRQMYTELRYPALDPAENERYERHRRVVYRLLGIDPDTFFRGKTVLDAGCGTGEETLFLASLGPDRVIGIDTSDGSLDYARQRAAGAGLTNVEFRHASVLDTSVFADAHFDYVSSLGCIHHTPRTQDAFDNLARMVRPGGHLCTFIYNSFGHFLYNLECDLLDRVAGDDIEARLRFARRWLDWRRADSFRREGIASSWDHRLYDKYGVLYRDSRSLGTLLDWYRGHGFSHVGSFPLALGDMVQAFRAHAGPDARGLKGAVARAAEALLPGGTPARRWSWPRRTRMQALLLLLGFWDYGSAFRILGRKDTPAAQAGAGADGTAAEDGPAA